MNLALRTSMRLVARQYFPLSSKCAFAFSSLPRCAPLPALQALSL